MATKPTAADAAGDTKISTHFSALETKLHLLTTLTDLYKTLTSQFTSTLETLDSKTLTLISTLESIPSDPDSSLSLRESSLSHRESYLMADIESKRVYTLAEIEGNGGNGPSGVDWAENLRGLCRRMDHEGLVSLLIAKRKESGALRGELGNAINGCVDPERFVLDAVEEFVKEKKAAMGSGGGGWSSELAHRRLACGLVVTGLFPAEELKKGNGDGVGPMFARSVVERAWRLVEEWKGTVRDGLSGGAAEAAMFLHLMIGFGFVDRFDEGFLKMLVKELAERKDYARLYGSVFGDKMGDVIEELANKNKEIEAVYFAASCGLTERFPPVTLLNSYLRRSKTNATNILIDGKNSAAAVEEADNLELQSLRTVIKCVEENKIEDEYPRLKNLRIRLAKLEQDRAKKRFNPSGGGGNNRPFSKRSESSGGRRYRSPLRTRPLKIPKYSDPYSTYDRRIPTPRTHQSPVPRYAGGPYSYPTSSAYATPQALTQYESTYGGPHIPSPAPIPQQHYQLPMNGASTVSYEGQPPYRLYDAAADAAAAAGYSSYDYSAVASAGYSHRSGR